MSTITRPRRLFRNPRPESVRSKPRGARVFDRLEERLVMSSFTVTDNSDLVTDTGSLRYAIAQVDASTDASNAITINSTLTGGQTITLTSALPQITQNVTIAGPGASVATVSGNNLYQVFNIAAGSTVAISGLTVTGGTGIGGSPYNRGFGGGIYNSGTLTVTGSTIDYNSAPGGGAGIFNDGSGALTVTGSTIAYNNSGYLGGGIGNAGALTVTGSTIASNSGAGGYGGGGIGNYPGGAVTVTDSTIAYNAAINSSGGGIFNDGIDGSPVTLTVTNSTIAYNSAYYYGGGIINWSGTLTVTDSTIASNSATYEGGGIWDDYFEGGMHGVSVDNTIIAGNTGPGGGPDVFGEVHSLGNNLVGDFDYTAGLTGTDLTGTVDSSGELIIPLDPKLGPLADNGGPTQTMALLAGSPAIDAGSNGLAVDPTTGQPLTYDQRGPGFLRVLGNSVDIGAFEAPAPLTVSNLQTAIATLPSGGRISIQADATQISTDLSAVNGLSAPSAPVSVSLDLGSQSTSLTRPINPPTGVQVVLTSSSGGATVSDATINGGDVVVQAGVTPTSWTVNGGNVTVQGTATAGDFIVNGGTVTLADGTVITGNSPAIIVNGGTVILQGVTAQTSTNSPTIVVNGGSLVVRNSTIQESAGFAQTAILITGGTVDLGTVTDAGNNTINVNGDGELIHNTSGNPVSAIADTFTINGVPLSPSSLSGTVFADFNDDGQVDFGEQGIAGVAITLGGTDFLGNPVHSTISTDGDGAYVFPNLLSGHYTISEAQPAGYTQGIDSVGTGGGSVSLDQFDLQLAAGLDALNYNYGERPAATAAIQHGQTAGIGFWNNKNGQALITALNGGGGTQLGDWLAATFPHMFGAEAGNNDLAGKSNADIASFFQSRFVIKQQKLDAQVLATALAVYVTDGTLDNTGVGTHYGFIGGGNGVATATFNVGANGAAFGVADNTTMTVMDILLAADAQSANGVLYNGNAVKDTKANTVFSAINQAGSI
ncbi:MAG: choice-of-anchor Q domain-containing protein [Isosphaerales bacterium]